MCLCIKKTKRKTHFLQYNVSVIKKAFTANVESGMNVKNASAEFALLCIHVVFGHDFAGHLFAEICLSPALYCGTVAQTTEYMGLICLLLSTTAP